MDAAVAAIAHVTNEIVAFRRVHATLEFSSPTYRSEIKVAVLIIFIHHKHGSSENNKCN